MVGAQDFQPRDQVIYSYDPSLLSFYDLFLPESMELDILDYAESGSLWCFLIIHTIFSCCIYPFET